MSDEVTEPPAWVPFGCCTYMILGLLFCLWSGFVRWMGPCPAFSSNTNCHWSRAYELWLFPVPQAAYLTIGILLMIFVKRRWVR